MGLSFGLLSLFLFPFYSSVSSFYSGFAVLAMWFVLGGFEAMYWSGGVLGFSSWGHSLVILTLVLSVAGMICCPPRYKCQGYYYSLSLVCVLSIFSFLSEGGFLFFLFFEGTFFPISYLILVWGYNKERIVAVLYMALYSFFGSIFHMVALSQVGQDVGFVYFSVVCALTGYMSWDLVVWFGVLVLLFLVKAPLFLWHLWLSKAHVEAPTGASMVLAAILLKLGLFGLVGYSSIWWGSWLGNMVQVVGLVGGVCASVVCLRSQNIKLTIAQSSVAHMSLCVSAFFCGSEGVFLATCLMAVIHGFCAAGMFAWAGRHYGFGGSQSSMLASGQRFIYLDGVVAMVLLLICNAGVPPFISFWAELIFFNSIYGVWVGSIYLLMGVSVSCMMFNVVFGLGLFHGVSEATQAKHKEAPVNEVVALYLMILVLVLGFLF